MSAPLCAHCTSHDRRACEGVRQFATITASCSCGCHFVPQAGGAVVLARDEDGEPFTRGSSYMSGSDQDAGVAIVHGGRWDGGDF